MCSTFSFETYTCAHKRDYWMSIVCSSRTVAGLFVFFHLWLAQLRSTLHSFASLLAVCLHTIMSLLSASPLARTRWKPNVTMHIWANLHIFTIFLDCLWKRPHLFTVSMDPPMMKTIWLCYRSYFSLSVVQLVLSITPYTQILAPPLTIAEL
jgi:hypothetical protein